MKEFFRQLYVVCGGFVFLTLGLLSLAAVLLFAIFFVVELLSNQ